MGQKVRISTHLELVLTKLRIHLGTFIIKENKKKHLLPTKSIDTVHKHICQF